MRFSLSYQTPANNRELMLIGDGRETNPTSEVFAYVESIDDVVSKLVCTDCQGLGTLPNTRSHTVILANAHCVEGRGLFWSACDCLLSKRGGFRTELENLIISLKNYQPSLDSYYIVCSFAGGRIAARRSGQIGRTGSDLAAISRPGSIPLRRFCRRKRLGACLPPGSLHFIFAS
jgi:hypothetical protein